MNEESNTETYLCISSNKLEIYLFDVIKFENLYSNEIIIENIPDIKDVNLLIDLLRGMGGDVLKVDDSTYKFQSKNIDLSYTKTSDFFRSAFLVLFGIVY